MKLIPNKEVTGLNGKPINVLERNLDGEAQYELGGESQVDKVKYKKMDVQDVITLLLWALPANVLTKQDNVHQTRLYGQLASAKDGILPIEDAEWDWITKCFKDRADQVAIKIFTVNTIGILESLERLEKEGREAKNT